MAVCHGEAYSLECGSLFIGLVSGMVMSYKVAVRMCCCEVVE